MEIHASIPENRVLQLTRRQKNGFGKHRSHFFLYNVFRHLELQQQTFLSFLTTKVKYLWSLKNQKAKQRLIETTVWQKNKTYIASQRMQPSFPTYITCESLTESIMRLKEKKKKLFFFLLHVKKIFIHSAEQNT